MEEMEAALKKMKLGKAPGEDGMTPEIIKLCSKSMKGRIHKLIVERWKNENIPNDFGRLE